MAPLNYNHLHYFWVVATLGSIAKAADTLHVTPQTISGQMRTLEARLGTALFQKSGRKRELTETGEIVRAYAEQMFSLGRELGDVLKNRGVRRSLPLRLGAATSVPKLVLQRVLAPALDHGARARVVCRQAPTDTIVADLLARNIDLALTDSPVASTRSVRVQSHLVGECGVTIMCARELADRYRARFPRSLDGAPFALPAKSCAVREPLLAWLRRERVAPLFVAEIESGELMSAICENGSALVALPSAIVSETERSQRVAAVGHAAVEQQFYVTTVALQIADETVAPLIEAARQAFRRDAHVAIAAHRDRDAA